jgi:hypothetical protein
MGENSRMNSLVAFVDKDASLMVHATSRFNLDDQQGV